MIHIKLCVNHECPSAEKCYRYDVDPNFKNTTYSYYIPTGDKCIHFVPNAKLNRRRKNGTKR